jgi:hypothetical protein
MKLAMDMLMPLTLISLTSCMLFMSCSGAGSSGRGSVATPAPPASEQTPTQSNVEQQRKDAQQQAHPEVEQQRKEAQAEGEKTLDKEAIEAIKLTQKAIVAIAANKNDEAVSALEQATGKLNILLARNPAAALISVSLEVDVIDAAPHDIRAIQDVAKDASRAVDDKNFPAARVLLYSLMSEIRARTYNLPLATYPAALTEAARLLGLKKTNDAKNVLLIALNTLVVVDRATPLPLILAREAINDAQAQSQKDKAQAQTLLETAKREVQRSKELGYAGKDQEYAALNSDISNLEKQLKGDGDVRAVFGKLKDRLGAFLKRQSEQKTS